LEYAASERRVCGLLGMAVSSYRYRTTRCDDELRRRLVELAREKPRFGYRRLHVLLFRAGEAVNHKRVHRVYREAGLSLRRKKRKHCVRAGQPLLARTAVNQEWALDFVHDVVECGRAIRVLSVVDAYTRECLALEVDTSFASRRVTRVLEAIMAERGQPGSIRCDNGPEFTSRHFLAWGVERKIEVVHIQPGKPTERAGGEFPRAVTGRMFERKLVPESVRCQAQDRSVEDGVQRRASAQQLGVSDTEGVCGAGNNELWKRRLPKNGKLGKR
jgi:putative transposase